MRASAGGELVPAVDRRDACAGTDQPRIELEGLAQGSGHLPDEQRRTPAQPRGQGDQTFPTCEARARAGKLLGTVEQAQAAFREGLITAAQADERPGITWAQRSAAHPAGHQPALEAGANDAHGAAAVLV